jgi:hypothetical protein
MQFTPAMTTHQNQPVNTRNEIQTAVFTMSSFVKVSSSPKRPPAPVCGGNGLASECVAYCCNAS